MIFPKQTKSLQEMQEMSVIMLKQEQHVMTQLYSSRTLQRGGHFGFMKTLKWALVLAVKSL